MSKDFIDVELLRNDRQRVSCLHVQKSNIANIQE